MDKGQLKFSIRNRGTISRAALFRQSGIYPEWQGMVRDQKSRANVGREEQLQNSIISNVRVTRDLRFYGSKYFISLAHFINK